MNYYNPNKKMTIFEVRRGADSLPALPIDRSIDSRVPASVLAGDAAPTLNRVSRRSPRPGWDGVRAIKGLGLGLAVAMAGPLLAMLQDADIASLDFGAAGNWIVLSSALMLGSVSRLAIASALSCSPE